MMVRKVHVSTYASIENFCVNDLLMWIAVHALTSPLSIEVDFEIMKLYMNAISSLMHQKQIWEVFPRELIKSFCDYTTISVGLGTLVKCSGDCDGNAATTTAAAAADLMKCEVLDASVNDTADEVMDAFCCSHDILLQHDNSDRVDESSVTHQCNMLL